MKPRAFWRSTVAFLLGAVLIAGCSKPAAEPVAEASPALFTYTPGPVSPFFDTAQVEKEWKQRESWLMPERPVVKGIYLTAYSVRDKAKFQQLIDLIDRTELNAMVINVKDDWGNITFEADLPLAKEAGAIHPDLGDVRALTQMLREKGIYTIARVVTFKDARVPKVRPELAAARTGGGVWRDYNEVTWLNPYNRDARDYVISVARAAAEAGFDEIQFDYVRFPTDGNLDTILYPGKDERKREQVIADFLAYARQELRPHRVWISADVFGLVTSTEDDMGIGQRLEEASAAVDILSPMVYPSHYIPGNLGVANPNAMPYETIYRSMLDAKERWEKAGLTGKVTMRPWLQDFSWGHPYGPAEVRAQIQATYDAGYSEWLLWNAANDYTEEALEKP
ncbi:MAG: putative glycoside hydrolase [Bacillota bacterium]